MVASNATHAKSAAKLALTLEARIVRTTLRSIVGFRVTRVHLVSYALTSGGP
jgi:hypothetical protein